MKKEKNKIAVLIPCYNESELYIYKNTYPELKEQSKLPLVNKIIKKVTSYY